MSVPTANEALDEVLEAPREIQVWQPLRSDSRGAFDLVQPAA